MPKRDAKQKTAQPDAGIYIITYVFLLLTGIIVYLAFSGNNKRLRLHAMQATALGVIWLTALAIFVFVPFLSGVLLFLIWVYAVYLGGEAYSGKDVEIPFITEYLRSRLYTVSLKSKRY